MDGNYSLLNDCLYIVIITAYLSLLHGRFKKVNIKGVESNDRSLPEEAILEKDRYPLLFKYNEVHYISLVMNEMEVSYFILHMIEKKCNCI